jgi:hypothetical protein
MGDSAKESKMGGTNHREGGTHAKPQDHERQSGNTRQIGKLWNFWVPCGRRKDEDKE